MASMNIEQAKSGIRWLITTFGGVIAGWFAAKGYFTIDQVTSVLSSETTVSLLASIGVGIWGLFVHSQTNAITVVDTIAKQPDSPVKAISTEPTVEGQALASSLPGNTTVVAGSVAATTAVKS
jgi:hypothetical protein